MATTAGEARAEREGLVRLGRRAMLSEERERWRGAVEMKACAASRAEERGGEGEASWEEGGEEDMVVGDSETDWMDVEVEEGGRDGEWRGDDDAVAD